MRPPWAVTMPCAIAIPRPLIVQAFNTSAGGGNNFDIYMGAGGFGAFNACDPNFTSQVSPSGLYLYSSFPEQGEPGSGGVNLTVQIGQRLQGGPGAVAAAFGLLSGPFVIVLALAIGYSSVNQLSVLHAILDGIAAAALGLTFATGLKLVHSSGARPLLVLITLATVLFVGVLRWPMIPVILFLAPVSIGFALVDRRSRHA